MISFPFVFFLVRSDTAFIGKPSHVCDSVSVRSFDVEATGRVILLSAGVTLIFAAVPLVQLDFATLGSAFAKIAVLCSFAVLSVV